MKNNKFLTKQKKKDIQKLAKTMSVKWIMQNNKLDQMTSYIYDVKSLKDLNTILDMTHASDFIRNYAQHRWFNYVVSKAYEDEFRKCGAVPAENVKDNEKDFYIDGTPYDLKVTTISKKYTGAPVDTEEGKDEYIHWLYENQSRQQRYHTKNRLFLVCNSTDAREALIQKANIEENVQKVKDYIASYKPQEVTLKSGKTVYSDIILAC